MSEVALHQPSEEITIVSCQKFTLQGESTKHLVDCRWLVAFYELYTSNTNTPDSRCADDGTAVRPAGPASDVCAQQQMAQVALSNPTPTIYKPNIDIRSPRPNT